MPYGKYVGVPVDQIPGPAYNPKSVVVGGNGQPLPSASNSSGSSLQKIIDSGVPITSGSSASQVDNSAFDLVSGLQSALSSVIDQFGNIGNGLSGTFAQGFNGLMDIIKKTTADNNAWSAAQAQKQMDFQVAQNQIAMDFNASEAAKNRDWQRLMSNTAHQREMADLKAAGLNPVLTATGGNGAAVTSGSAASGVTSAGAQADADQSGNAALAALYGSIINAQTQMANANLSAQTNLRMAEIQKETTLMGAEIAAQASMANAETNAAASRYGAGLNAAAMQYSAEQSRAASQYASDQTYKNNQEQREWNLAHPQTNAGIVSAVQNEMQQRQNWIKEKGQAYLDKYLDVPPWLANLFS